MIIHKNIHYRYRRTEILDLGGMHHSPTVHMMDRQYWSNLIFQRLVFGVHSLHSSITTRRNSRSLYDIVHLLRAPQCFVFIAVPCRAINTSLVVIHKMQSNQSTLPSTIPWPWPCPSPPSSSSSCFSCSVTAVTSDRPVPLMLLLNNPLIDDPTWNSYFLPAAPAPAPYLLSSFLSF